MEVSNTFYFVRARVKKFLEHDLGYREKLELQKICIKDFFMDLILANSTI